MSPDVRPANARTDRDWFVLGRRQQYEAEGRVNLLRGVGVGLFYLIELAQYHGVAPGLLEMTPLPPEPRPFHDAVTMLAALWAALTVLVGVGLRSHFFPPWLPYVTTVLDLLLLTAVLAAANGPKSPLVAVYFLLLALAALRLDLRLLWLAAAGAVVSYLFLLAYVRWWVPERELRVPRYHQAMVVLALVLTAVTLGQLIRRVGAMIPEYARRLRARPEARL
jgi:hypothetical protein